MKKILEVEIKDDILTLASDIVYEQKLDWCNATVRPLKLSLIRPRNYFNYDCSATYPLLVWICGGGFAGVDHNVWVPELVYFAKRDFAVACISYSIKDETRFPERETEVKSAIRYLRAHAGMYNINTDHIVIMGESAGAYLAAFTGLTNKEQEYEKGDNLNEDSFLITKVLAGNLWIGTKKMTSIKMAAVTDNVSELFPPAYISDAGVNSFSEQARRFYSKLNTVGVMAMLNIYSGNNPEISHGFECIDTVYSRDNANKMISF